MRLAVTVAVLVAAVLGLALWLPWLKTPLLIALADGLAVAGVIVLIRAGQVSFGHAMYACLAGYAVAFIGRAFHLDALLLIALGTGAAALAGAVIGVFMVRYRGIFFGMLNLAFSMVLFSVLGKFGAVTGGTAGLRFDRPTLAGVHLEVELADGDAVRHLFRVASGLDSLVEDPRYRPWSKLVARQMELVLTYLESEAKYHAESLGQIKKKERAILDIRDELLKEEQTIRGLLERVRSAKA